MSKNAIKTEVGTLKAVQTKKGKNGEFTVITFTVLRTRSMRMPISTFCTSTMPRLRWPSGQRTMRSTPVRRSF